MSFSPSTIPPRRFFVLLAIITGVAIVLGSLGWPGKNPPRKTIKDVSVRKAAPDFELKDVNGKVVHLSDYKGKVVLLDFWATWCGPCAIEIPWFIEFQRKYKDRGFTVLGVSMDDSSKTHSAWEEIKPFAAEHKINYQIVLGDEQTSDMYGDVEALPTTFVVDREGRIASIHVGLVPKKEFDDAIQKLL